MTRRWSPRLPGIPRKILAFVALGSILGAAIAVSHAVDAGRAPGVVALSSAGRPVRWVSREIVIEPVRPAKSFAAETLQAALVEGASAWNELTRSCGAPRLRVLPSSATGRELRRDGVSTLLVRTRHWCPERRRDEDDCYDPSRSAITHLYPDDPPDQLHADIREADIEINAVHFTWSKLGDELGTRNLQATVIHELGHVLGLEHPCNADVIPSGKEPCDASHRHALMYPVPDEAGRVSVLRPTAGEVATLCALYE